ncbi:MAG: hypothetical protein GZ091_02475 [Paludibacter sp.]|nr:hypothetical protein [Paludibacter sp.]
MDKKEHYRHQLPHFQQSGQAYFVTWCLKDAIPPKALERYTIQIANLLTEIDLAKKAKADDKFIAQLKLDYHLARKKYIKAFGDLLHLQEHSIVNLAKEANLAVVKEALTYWEGKRLENYAFCIMSNHVHWVFRLYEKDENDKPVYLQDIMQSVKRTSANKINKLENRTGALWQKESFDTTIRDDKHLYNAINYTINNPVAAGLVKNWWEWKGTWCIEGMGAAVGCSGL